MPDASQPGPATPRSPAGGATRTRLAQLADRDVVALMQAGQSSALSELYDRYGALVYRMALRMLGNAQEAEDLTQDIFLGIYRRNTYDPKRGSLSSFLMTLTRSRSIDRLRSRQSRWRFFKRLEHRESAMDASNLPLDRASQGELSVRVREALQTLPEAQREVLEMAYYEGLSQSEIAQRLDAPLGTVKTRSRQGLLKLRTALQDLVD